MSIEQPDTTGPTREPISDLQRYRSLVGHLICDSLGYFTPQMALRAVQSHRDSEPFPCEWYSYMASCQGKGMFDHQALIEINRATLERAFQRRHEHSGYMAEYLQAKVLVNQEIKNQGSTDGMLASWF